MTFRTIDTDMATVGATAGSDSLNGDVLSTGVARRARSARRANILSSRFRSRSTRVWAY